MKYLTDLDQHDALTEMNIYHDPFTIYDLLALVGIVDILGIIYHV
ncbi:MAG TPA: hypothetical protein VE130_06510 [Nitrososphaeraceae archaeon]|jgi:hypothetical protein|nr:hypothetical protein [Nitrososphaeraceae archaeon]